MTQLILNVSQPITAIKVGSFDINWWMPNWTLADYVRFTQRKNRDNSSGQAGDVEPPVGHVPDGPIQIPPEVKGKVRIIIQNCRTRLADSDGISCKALIDWLCRTRDPNDPNWRLLPGDKARDIDLVVTQHHCKHGEPEMVIITIEKEQQ